MLGDIAGVSVRYRSQLMSGIELSALVGFFSVVVWAAYVKEAEHSPNSEANEACLR